MAGGKDLPVGDGMESGVGGVGDFGADGLAEILRIFGETVVYGEIMLAVDGDRGVKVERFQYEVAEGSVEIG